MVKEEDKVRENYCRRWAKRLGLVLRKSHAKLWRVDNQQWYMLVDLNNSIVAGEKYNLELAGVESLLKKQEEELRKK
jgi:hypothetical protein